MLMQFLPHFAGFAGGLLRSVEKKKFVKTCFNIMLQFRAFKFENIISTEKKINLDEKIVERRVPWQLPSSNERNLQKGTLVN